jgi:hypothetical protein
MISERSEGVTTTNRPEKNSRHNNGGRAKMKNEELMNK